MASDLLYRPYLPRPATIEGVAAYERSLNDLQSSIMRFGRAGQWFKVLTLRKNEIDVVVAVHIACTARPAICSGARLGHPPRTSRGLSFAAGPGDVA
jgi:hypothetical protein